MTVIAADSSINYAQPQLPPAPTYTVTGKETVTQVAQQFNVTPEELASTNRISVDTVLSPGQALTLPPHAVANATQAAPATQTPAQKTDAAIAAYQGALKQRDDDMRSAPHNAGLRADLDSTGQDRIDAAKKAMDQAIADEVAGEVAFRNQSTPVAFRAPADQLIDSAGNAIVARHPGDATLDATIKGSVQACKFQNQVNTAIPGTTPDESPAAKLKGVELEGQPPEVVAAVLADPRVQGWIEDAADQIGQTYHDDNPASAAAAAHALLDTVQDLPPPLAAAVVRQSMPTIRKFAQVSMNGPGEQAFGTMQRVVGALGNDADASKLTAQIASAYLPQAERWSGQAFDSIQNAISGGVDPALAKALANGLQQDGKQNQADGINVAAVQGLQRYLAFGKGNPRQAYEDAQTAKQAKDQRLRQLLQNAGPLTATQQANFSKAYMADPDNAKVYQTYANAAQNLTSYMNAHKDDLLSAAKVDPDAAAQLYQCMKDAVQSGQGVTAVQFANAIQADPDTLKIFDGLSGYEDSFLPDALASAQAQLLVKSGGDPTAAVYGLTQLAEPLLQAKDGWAATKTNYERLANNEDRAFSPEQLKKEFEELGPGDKMLAKAAIVISLFNGTEADNMSSMINSYASALGGSVTLATGAVQSLADAGELGRYTESAQSFTNFSSRLIPGLSVIASTSAFVSDINSAGDNPLYAGAVIGDVFSMMGSWMETTLAGEVPGAFINGVGAFISGSFQFAGTLFGGDSDAEQLHKDVEKYLGPGGANLDPADVKLMSGSDPGQVRGWLATGIAPEELQELARLQPQLLQSDSSGGPSIDWLKGAGLSGQDVYDMLKAAEAGSKTPAVSVSEVMKVLGNPTWYGLGSAHNKVVLANDLRAIAQQQRSDTAGDRNANAQGAQALENAADWLERHETA
ncbi:LysM domain-containing protein [Dyella marensis]|uniref:LysM domain-containing protein n=1 Tax=Dyella marensis TaxID=500610 RepID=A0A1I2GE66_9GAMM|nr:MULTISPECIES: LysM domain-containing protein [Dyella]SFF15483.1 LysM domain-containing protein [Dyella marensis]